jgi:hypothetical protein
VQLVAEERQVCPLGLVEGKDVRCQALWVRQCVMMYAVSAAMYVEGCCLRMVKRLVMYVVTYAVTGTG